MLERDPPPGLAGAIAGLAVCVLGAAVIVPAGMSGLADRIGNPRNAPDVVVLAGLALLLALRATGAPG